LVSPIVAIIGIGVLIIALTKFSVKEAFAFVNQGEQVDPENDQLGSDFSGQQQAFESGNNTLDDLQTNKSIPIKQGSQTTVNTIQEAQIIRTDVRNKQKMNQGSAKPKIRVAFDNPKEGGSQPQAGVIRTTANTNFSNGAQFGKLTQAQVGKLRAQPLTLQEQQDLMALQARINRKSPDIAKLKDSPLETIFKKREQALIAERFVNIVTSFGGTTRSGFVIPDKRGVELNPDFVLGGKSLEEFNRDQAEKEGIRKKVLENAILRRQERETGQTILSTINKSGMNQRQFLLGRGINLNTGDLSARALAKLQRGGLQAVNDPEGLRKTPSFDFASPSVQPSKPSEDVPTVIPKDFATDPNLSQQQKAVFLLRSRGGFNWVL